MTGHEATLRRQGRRQRLGAWYTPDEIVEGLLRLTLDPIVDRAVASGGVDAVAALRVLDPACGTGNFLAAAADRIADALARHGVPEPDARSAAEMCVVGVDIDPDAAAICADRLPGARVLVDDALLRPPAEWSVDAPDGFEVVVGNPPFLGQLRSRTATDPETAAALRDRFGSVIGSYTDPAALFLLLATELASPSGGRVGLVLPQPILATRDAAGVREAVRRLARPTDLWVADGPVFDASVAVCALVLDRGARPPDETRAEDPTVRLWSGSSFAPAGTSPALSRDARTWSTLLARSRAVPDRALAVSGRLGDLARATADFRDQYYGLAGHVLDVEVADDRSRPRLVTAGLIDPAALHWGRRRTRFAKQGFLHPRVDVASLASPLQGWAAQRLVPKVLLATQTRTLEAIVDADGSLLPSVPVITISSFDPAHLWRIGALLCSPPIAMEAARRHLGAGRNATALKLRAAEVLDLPLPFDASAWDDAADAFAQASRSMADGDVDGHRAGLEASAAAMVAAYGLGDDPELVGWWQERLPR